MVKVEDLSRLIRNIRHNSLVFKPHSLSLPELFIPFSELVRPATTPFYAKLDQTLASFDFATQARSLCAPAYSVNGRGRPGIDPVVYFKMLGCAAQLVGDGSLDFR